MNSWPQFQGRRLVNALLLSVACFWGATGLLAAAPGLSIALTNGQPVELVRITAGQFMMGSPTNEPGRNPDEFQHRVRLKRDYLIGREPVTVGQFEAFTRDTGYRTEAERGPSGGFGWNGQELVQRKEFTWRSPGFPQTATQPVVMVTWDDARAFCSWVSRRAGRACRLPSEAEREFACRSGSTGAFPSGAADEIAWHLGNSGGSTHPVGGKRANLWGLHDMAGNVFEWCSDWHVPYASAAVVDPAGPASSVDAPRRVLRGGSWLRDAKFCRSAARYRNSHSARNADNGFREVVEIPKGAVHNQNLSRNMSPLFPLLLLVFFAIFSVVVIGLVIALWRRRSGSASGGVSAPSSSRTDLVSTVRVAVAPDDFWLRSAAVAAGMLIGYRYFVASGGRTSQVQFAPGPDGHFVFTGERPDHVEITHVTSAESGIDPSVVVSDSGSTYSRDLLTAETWRQTHLRDDDSPPPLSSSAVYEPPAPPAY